MVRIIRDPRSYDGGGVARRQVNRVSALAGNRNVPYDAADYDGEHTATWRPSLNSADVNLNPYRDQIVARSRDLARNDGWASGTITRIQDNAIGATFRPIAKPDYRALATYSGIRTFDAVWADEYGRALDAKWRDWADDHTGRYCDAQRSSWMPLIFGVAFRHLLIDNDALAILPWLPERIGPGRAKYATAVQLIDPDRLSNPQQRFDWRTVRGGVEVDEYGAAVGYHIRKAHMNDYWAAGDSVTWEYIARETDWGRPIVVHYFEPDQASQHRGGNGIFTSVLQRMKMLFRYDVAELDAALINAIFAAIIESPFDESLLKEALGEDVGGEGLDGMRTYQDDRSAFHRERRTMVGNTQITQTYPGETFKMVSPDRPNPNFANFEKAVLRNTSQAAGTASQWVTGDYSDTNYSSMRAALLDAWKTIHRRRANFGAGFGTPIRAALVEEIMELGELDDLLPNGAPRFIECRQAYSACKWLGPGRGWVDPVADRQGAIMGLGAHLTTLEDEVAEVSGQNWEDILDQQQVEQQATLKRGLPLSSPQVGAPANESAKKPEAE
jgi:lambda family phage portal protein